MLKVAKPCSDFSGVVKQLSEIIAVILDGELLMIHLSLVRQSFLLPLLAMPMLMAQLPLSAQTVIHRTVVTGTPDYYDPGNPGNPSYSYPQGWHSRPGPVRRGNVEDSTLVNPVIINPRIEDSTIVNPVIVSPRRSSTTVIQPYPSSGQRSTGQSNPACMAFSEMRIACQ